MWRSVAVRLAVWVAAAGVQLCPYGLHGATVLLTCALCALCAAPQSIFRRAEQQLGGQKLDVLVVNAFGSTAQVSCCAVSSRSNRSSSSSRLHACMGPGWTACVLPADSILYVLHTPVAQHCEPRQQTASHMVAATPSRQHTAWHVAVPYPPHAMLTNPLCAAPRRPSSCCSCCP